jgi:hypothetical protein
MSRSQNRVFRDSFRQTKFLAMKSALVCPAWQPSAELRDLTGESESAIAEVAVVNHERSL